MIFLAEAFTYRAMMQELGKAGFSQGYTYFTWKQTAAELPQVVAGRPEHELFRPNFFVNTPDILTEQLQLGGPAALRQPADPGRHPLRPATASTPATNSFEHVAVTPGSEEYLDSEESEAKERTLDGELLPLLAHLNRIRRTQPALQRIEGTRFLETENEQLLAYAKQADGDTVLCVVLLDPIAYTKGCASCPTTSASTFEVEDRLTGERFRWQLGRKDYVRLVPGNDQPRAGGGGTVTPPRTASVARLERWLQDQRWYRQGEAPPLSAPPPSTSHFPTEPPIEIVLWSHHRRPALPAGPVRCRATPTSRRPPPPSRRFVAKASPPDPPGAAASAAIAAHWVGAPWAPPPPVPGRRTSPTPRVAVGGTRVSGAAPAAPRRPPRGGGGPPPAGQPHHAGARPGWLVPLVAPDGTSTVLGVVHELVAGALDGWALVLSALAADPNAVLRSCGSWARPWRPCTHTLALPTSDRGRHVRGGAAGRHRGVGPGRRPADRPAPARPQHTTRWARAVTAIGDDTGSAIRTHGDLHLGQTLVGADGWRILDFEGEPSALAHPPHLAPPRRGRHDPVPVVRRGPTRRAGGAPLSDDWEDTGPRRPPCGRLLTHTGSGPAAHLRGSHQPAAVLHELEKVLYEIGYEHAHRPEWETHPQAGLRAVLARAGR